MLAGPWYFDRKGEIPDGKDPFFLIPVFNYHEVTGWFSSNELNSNEIESESRLHGLGGWDPFFLIPIFNCPRGDLGVLDCIAEWAGGRVGCRTLLTLQVDRHAQEGRKKWEGQLVWQRCPQAHTDTPPPPTTTTLSLPQGYLSINFSSNYYLLSQRHPQVPRLTPQHLEAIKVFEELAASGRWEWVRVVGMVWFDLGSGWGAHVGPWGC